MSWQKGLEAPQQTLQFAWLQSTSFHYLNLIFHGQGTEMATRRQKVLAGKCKVPSPIRKTNVTFL